MENTTQSELRCILPIWLYDKTFEITKIYHYTSMVNCVILRVENYGSYTGIFSNFIQQIEKQLIDNNVLFDNKTVYEIKFFHQTHLITLYCGFYDDTFSIGLAVDTESLTAPTKVNLFAK